MSSTVFVSAWSVSLFILGLLLVNDNDWWKRWKCKAKTFSSDLTETARAAFARQVREST